MAQPVREVIEVLDDDDGGDGQDNGSKSSNSRPQQQGGESGSTTETDKKTNEEDEEEMQYHDSDYSSGSSVGDAARPSGGASDTKEGKRAARHRKRSHRAIRPPAPPGDSSRHEEKLGRGHPHHQPAATTAKADYLAALGFPSSMVAGGKARIGSMKEEEGGGKLPARASELASSSGGGAAAGSGAAAMKRGPARPLKSSSEVIRSSLGGSRSKQRSSGRSKKKACVWSDDEEEEDEQEEEDEEEEEQNEEAKETGSLATVSLSSSQGKDLPLVMRPPQAQAWTAVEEEEAEEDRQDDNILCEVCFRTQEPQGNQIVLCGEEDRACCSVHQMCYHVPTIPDGDWYCDLCKHAKELRFRRKGPPSSKDKKEPVPLPNIICQLCGNLRGAFIEVVVPQSTTTTTAKPVVQYVHKLCALSAQPYVSFVAGTARQKVIGPIGPLPFFDRPCQFCHRRGGMILTCIEPGCPSYFHAMCASRQGSMPHIQTGNHWIVKMWCPSHQDKYMKLWGASVFEEGIPKGYDYVDDKLRILQEMLQGQPKDQPPRRPVLIPLPGAKGRYYAITPELAATLQKTVSSGPAADVGADEPMA